MVQNPIRSLRRAAPAITDPGVIPGASPTRHQNRSICYAARPSQFTFHFVSTSHHTGLIFAFSRRTPFLANAGNPYIFGSYAGRAGRADDTSPPQFPMAYDKARIDWSLSSPNTQPYEEAILKNSKSEAKQGNRDAGVWHHQTGLFTRPPAILSTRPTE